MPKVKYSGGFRPGVTVSLEDGTSVEVEYLHEIEVSGAERDRLLEQDPDSWSEVKPATTDKKEK